MSAGSSTEEEEEQWRSRGWYAALGRVARFSAAPRTRSPPPQPPSAAPASVRRTVGETDKTPLPCRWERHQQAARGAPPAPGRKNEREVSGGAAFNNWRRNAVRLMRVDMKLTAVMRFWRAQCALATPEEIAGGTFHEDNLAAFFKNQCSQEVLLAWRRKEWAKRKEEAE